MDDKELLTFAAKAAGIPDKALPHSGSDWIKWLPLDDDGDALRLAVKLRLTIEPNYSWEVKGDMTTSVPHESITCGSKYDEDWSEEIYNDDPYAATRRAIVRAVAEIGKRS